MLQARESRDYNLQRSELNAPGYYRIIRKLNYTKFSERAPKTIWIRLER